MREVRESLTPEEYEGWWLYWQEEPWGPYRDNLHAAIIAREVIRPHLKRHAKVDIKDFMLQPAEQKAAARVDSFIQALFAMSKPKGKAKAVPKRKAKSAKR